MGIERSECSGGGQGVVVRAVCCVVALVAGACSGGQGEPERLENLLLVVLDTTRPDHLSIYGHSTQTSKEIDNLGRGVRFEAAFSQSSLTPVSAASLLTGTLPHKHGVRSLFVVGQEELSPEVPSLFELLQQAGLATAGFVSAKPMGAQYGLARGFDVYDDDLSETAQRHGIQRFADAPQRPADETVDRALSWLEEHEGERFAMLLHMFDAHDPSFVPPREFLQERLSFPVPEDLGRTASPASWPELFEPAHVLELYDAEIAWMSAQVARVLAGLEETGMRRNTLVCVVADHGEAFGEHDFWTHGILYEEQLRVPLMLHGTGLPRGVVVPDTVRLVDVPPTLLELLEIDAGDAAFDGSSLLGYLRPPSEGRPSKPREVQAEVHHAAEDRLRRPTELYSLRVGRWKYIHRPTDGAHELYDLEADPAELDNRYEAEQSVAKVLQARLLESGAVDGEVPSLEGIPAEELERLRELGYL